MLIDHVFTHTAGRDQTFTAEVTRLATPDGDIPIVAACRIDHIALYHWHKHKQRWRSITINHKQVEVRDSPLLEYEPETCMMSNLSRVGWSHRVGLASGLDLVFLVYRRLLENDPFLYLEVFQYNPVELELEPVTDGPVAIPYSRGAIHHTGYYFWAGFSPANSADPDTKDRLVILTQTYFHRDGPVSLQYFSVEARDDPGHYKDPDSWTFRVIGDQGGGYDLDACIRDGELHTIFRQIPYPVSFHFSGPNVEENGALDVSHGQYAPLRYMRLRADDGHILGEDHTLPGGEHPQIQSVQPLAYTADRMSKGQVVMDMSARPPDLRYEVTHSQKNLFLFEDGDWLTIPLMEFPEDQLPQSPFSLEYYWFICDPILHVPDRSGHFLEAARVHPLLPVHATRLIWEDQRLELDLLHHNLDLEALVMTRIQHEPLDPSAGAPDLNLYAILNINHEDLPPFYEVDPSTASETASFIPYKLDPLQGKSGAFQWTLRGNDAVISSTGGYLAIEPRTGDTRTFVFVHSGDGGVRLVPDYHSEQAKVVFNPSPQQHDPDAVVGDGRGVMRTVQQSGQWLNVSVDLDDHFYANISTVFCGLEHEIHALFAAAHAQEFGTLSEDETTVTMDLAMASATPEGMLSWSALWAIWSQINDQTAAATDLLSNIGDMTLELSRFTISWKTAPQEVIVQVGPDFHEQYRFLGRNAGQGRIECRFRSHIELPELQLARWIRPLATASIEVDMDYRRPYSPAVLMHDVVRVEKAGGAGAVFKERLDRGSRHDAVALTTKPVDDCELRPVEIEPAFKWTVGGHALVVFLPLIIELLTGLGLRWLAISLGGLAADLAAAASSIVGVIAAIGFYVAIIIILEDTVPGEINKAIQAQLAEYDFKDLLDSNNTHTNAGEGIAEDIAWRVLKEVEREGPGANRFKQAVWRMLYVTDGECRVFMDEP